MPTPRNPGLVSIKNITVYCEIIAALRHGRLMAHEISAAIGQARRYADGFLWTMRTAGLVMANRGSNGGYILTDKGKAVDAAGLVKAIHGPLKSPLITAWRRMTPEEVAARSEIRRAA